MNDPLKLAIEGHGGLRRWEQVSWFGAAWSITSAIWALKGKPGLLDGVVLQGNTRAQRLTSPHSRSLQLLHLGTRPAEHRDRPRRAGHRAPRPGGVGHRHGPRLPWDEFQVAYFVGEASWN